MNELANMDSLDLESLREQVTEGLVQRYAGETLGLDDFERRTALVTKAASRQEILAAVLDLPDAMPSRMPSAAPTGTGVAAARRTGGLEAGSSGWRIASDPPRDLEHIVCVFGGTDRRGVWRAPRKLDSLCVFGGANIDLRKAVIPPEGITIRALAVFGGLDVIVPPDLRLEVKGIGIFGGFDHRDNPDAPESAPLVRIEGLACFGGVGVRVRE